nr:tetratricopeptide repeat-containing protein [Rhizobium sp. Q54]
MRRFRFSLLILAALLAAPVAFAQEPETPPVQATPSAPRDALASLFESLKRERDPEKARGIASQILSEWSDSGSATVDLLMQWAATAVSEKRNAAALDFLDQVTVLKPDYAEAWNRRAGLHFTMGDRRKAMADINQVLIREPRHFGALSGLAEILAGNGQDELALKAWERYLEIYPADRDAQEAATELSEKIAGSRT